MPLTTPTGTSSLDMFPSFGALETAQCEDLLKRNVVGRLAFSLQDYVSIVPVHYVYDEGWIYGRTEPGGKLVPILRNRSVAFEVDEQQGMFSWQSVIIHGPLYLIDPAASAKEKIAYETALRLLRRMLPTTFGKSDPVPFRNQLFRIQVSEISGRSATLGGTRLDPAPDAMRDETAKPDLDTLLRIVVKAAVARTLVTGSSRVHVDAFDGIVVLTGIVDTPERRTALEREILALDNVKAIVQQLETAFPATRHATATDLARDSVRVLQPRPMGMSRNVKVVVENEWLRAEGAAATRETKDEVLRSLAAVKGARGIIDRIQIVADPA